MYRASAGTVYPTLAQLQDEGLVLSESKDGKRVYQLTDAGRRYALRVVRIHRLWERYLSDDAGMPQAPQRLGLPQEPLPRVGQPLVEGDLLLGVLDVVIGKKGRDVGARRRHPQ